MFQFSLLRTLTEDMSSSSDWRVLSWTVFYFVTVLLMMCSNVECQEQVTEFRLPFNVTSPFSVFTHQLEHAFDQLSAVAGVAARKNDYYSSF
ncbi:unnamed protein product [Danaus chrysippus]|uniref:(African queen) hypothetical protein n=1 Tax=Danaus chrysippus TaxID=151541 RepID=A0A8J2QY26_9NEOP|nr:unnamed protein product [Danaus chrysippus]